MMLIYGGKCLYKLAQILFYSINNNHLDCVQATAEKVKKSIINIKGCKLQTKRIK